MAYFADSMPNTGVTAKDQMRWQEFMSDTSHQREMADLKAAGLNPVLSAGGSGASTPSGSQDSSETLALLSGMTALADSVNSGKARRQQEITEETTDAIEDAVKEGLDSVIEGIAGLFPGKLSKLVKISASAGRDNLKEIVHKYEPEIKAYLDEQNSAERYYKNNRAAYEALKKLERFRG